jgi:pyrroloquinoline quinone (PQQ) biosynthesis protein C
VAEDDLSGGDLPPELLTGPTDIASLVAREQRRGRRTVYLSNRVVGAWERRGPGHWERFRRWLEARGIGVVRIDP